MKCIKPHADEHYKVGQIYIITKYGRDFLIKGDVDSWSKEVIEEFFKPCDFVEYSTLVL